MGNNVNQNKFWNGFKILMKKKEVMKILLSRLCSTHHIPVINDVGSSWSISFISICIVQSTTSVNCASTLVQRLWKAISLQINNANLKVSFSENRVRTWIQVVSHQKNQAYDWLTYLIYLLIKGLYLAGKRLNSCPDSDLWKTYI